MVDYSEPARSNTTVPCTPAPDSQQQGSLTEALAEVSAPRGGADGPTAQQYRQGKEAGDLEATHLLTQVAQRKGDTLTASEIREAGVQRWVKDILAWEEDGTVSASWLAGWRKGFVAVTRRAERHASWWVEAYSDTSAASTVTLTLMPFRRALVAIEDPQEFQHGLRSGQMGYIDTTEEGETLTAAGLLREVQHMLTSAYVSPDLSLGWYAGFLLGYLDALLRGRKTYPREKARQKKNSPTGARV